MNDRLKQLYDKLAKDGYELPHYDQFVSDMGDATKANALYTNLVKDGYELPNSFEKFHSDIHPASPNQTLGIDKAAQRFTSGLANTIQSGFTDVLPMEGAQVAQQGEANVGQHGQDWESYIRGQAAPQFQHYVRQKENIPWYKPFDTEEHIAKHGPEFIANSQQKASQLEGYVQQQKAESQEKLKGTTQRLEDIHSAGDLTSFIGNMFGQAIYRIPVSAGTGTVGSYIAESAAVWDEQLDQLAKKHGISRKEVIDRGLSKPLEGEMWAGLAGALDAASAGNLIGAFKRLAGKNLTRKAIDVLMEGLTEPIQGTIERGAGAAGAGVPFAPLGQENLMASANEFVQGLGGGALISSLTPSPEKGITAPQSDLGQTTPPTAPPTTTPPVAPPSAPTAAVGVTVDPKTDHLVPTTGDPVLDAAQDHAITGKFSGTIIEGIPVSPVLNPETGKIEFNEQDNALENSQTSQNNGGSSTQPEIRQETGNPGESSQGIQPGGQGGQVAPKEENPLVLELETQRKGELKKASRPTTQLNFVTDKAALRQKIEVTNPVTGKTTTMPADKKNRQLQRESEQLEALIDCLHGIS